MRPESNTVEYFPHYIGNGKKIFYIEKKYGNDGYATWFKILETLAQTDYHFLNLNADEDVFFLAAKCNVSDEKLIEIIDDLARVGAINKMLWKNRILWSEKFVESLKFAYTRRKNNCMQFSGLCRHLLGLGIQILINDVHDGYENTQSKVKESKVKKSKHFSGDVIEGDFDDVFTPNIPKIGGAKTGKKSEPTGIDFEVFWGAYDRKVGDKKNAKKKWDRLPLETQNIILEKLPPWKAQFSEKRFQPYPESYLNQERWNDEIFTQTQNQTENGKSEQDRGTRYRGSYAH